MDRFIINGIKQLYVLKPYHSNSMDELAKDLTTVLDESSDRRIHEGKVKRSKSWKCRSKAKCGLMLGSSVPKSSTKSEDSESSLDNWIQQQMDFSTNGSHQHTDSDDIIYKVNQRSYHLTSWRHCAPNVGESDSVNENLHPSREPRRKRKFKRMTVDPPSVAEQDFASLPSVSSFSSFSQKSKRPRSLKAHKISKLSVKAPKLSKITTVSQLSAEMENICKEFGNAASSSGKRKRCAHERSIECTGCDCKEFISSTGNVNPCRFSNPCHHMKYINLKSHEISSSGLSSSESEHEILNNEESREADDEQSDFFQESGPTSGIPNVSRWWEKDNFIPDEKQISDPKFEDILCESFRDMSETAKNMYTLQLDKFKSGRQIRSGRRRLGKGVSPIDLKPDEVLPYMTNRNDKSCISNAETCFTKTTPNEKKKRKGMTPSSGSLYGYGELAGGVAESNLGFQVLKKMGWKPGTGLGRLEAGIISPVKATANNGKQGLGFSKTKSENVFSAPQVAGRNPSQSPPPPPPSPQSIFVKNESST